MHNIQPILTAFSRLPHTPPPPAFDQPYVLVWLEWQNPNGTHEWIIPEHCGFEEADAREQVSQAVDNIRDFRVFLHSVDGTRTDLTEAIRDELAMSYLDYGEAPPHVLDPDGELAGELEAERSHIEAEQAAYRSAVL